VPKPYIYCMMKKRSLFIAIAAICISCNQRKQSLEEKQGEIENGKIDESYAYESKEVGWTTLLPKDWNVITRKESKAINEKGKKEVEKTTGIKIDASDLMELVNIKKDVFNSFLSTMQHFDEKTDGSYEETNKSTQQLILNTYKGKGIKVDSKEGKESIGGLEFYTFFVSIHAPGADSNKIILTQEMYSRLQNGYDFSMTLNYNDEKDSAILQDILKNSTFRIYK
jgi:hypothetical protein